VSPPTQRTKRRQQPEETRRQILAAGQAFLRERPYRDLNVDALMAMTGHTRTVFYRHFDDIPALILALIGELGGELVEVGEEWGRTGTADPGEARERLAVFVDFYARNGHLVRAVVDAARHSDAVNAAYSGMIEGFVTLTADAMRARIADGDLEPLDAPEIARALIWMLNGYLLDRLGGHEQSDPDHVLETVWTVWTRTLYPRA
jgi:AcrR family transcriptional regulator